MNKYIKLFSFIFYFNYNRKKFTCSCYTDQENLECLLLKNLKDIRGMIQINKFKPNYTLYEIILSHLKRKQVIDT